ncbi:MAG TPA: AbrB/MazE/SpoVT family DNA-binding domain-containing protein [Thermoplasmatales archaeon]|nr:AbrB/MazE/SpoVT family DNA-binding domain-containing protein [Thermoplasmatales archaeon]
MKGRCRKTRIVYGIVTVSDKGQIAIPVDLRKDLDIKQGDKLFILKRKDETGFTLIKLEEIDGLMYNLQEDEEFFKKIKRR